MVGRERRLPQHKRFVGIECADNIVATLNGAAATA
jgi:hypothetical protein